MKKFFALLLISILIFVLAGCGGQNVTADYNTSAELETALNNGEDVTGKVAKINVVTLVPDSVFGYNIQTGEHLNFCSAENPKVSEGDTVLVRITEVQSLLGSFIIFYERLG